MTGRIGRPFENGTGFAEFQQSLDRLRDGEWAEAIAHARRAMGKEPNNPFFLSYAGLLAALTHDWIADGELLCLDAIRLRPNEPQLYLNLAKVYQHAGRWRDASKTLEEGLISTGQDSRIQQALERTQLRRQPVIPFLRRGHFLNRTLGRLRHQLLGPLRPQ